MQGGAEGPLIGVVDDHESVREDVSSLLRSAAYRTTTFASAEDSLDRDQRYEVSCIVLDIHMPGMAASSCNSCFIIPIIFMTAHEDKLGGRALKGGAPALFGESHSATRISSMPFDQS